MRIVQVHLNTNRRTKMSNSLALRRRTFLNFGLLGAAVSAALPVKAFAQAPANVSFIAPTADNPIRINFNENALHEAKLETRYRYFPLTRRCPR